ncbi:MAG TPA: protease HtpX [Steroidobacteraceae bacterium]|jgi:heat shock protein HtpX|nr:protease HtpX [Steroidobacteraceae bacterium]
MKRIFLFIATNLAIVFVLNIVLHLLGVDRIFNERGGLDINSLLIFSAVFGFAGSFISLAISKWMAKTTMGVRVITQPANSTEIWLVGTVQKFAREAGIGMPEVGIFDSPDMNAFATGARRDSALVAVSSGLLQNMSRAEAEAVIGHEISHVANGDMVTLTLIQGVVNTFVIFLSRVIGYVVDRIILKNDREGTGIGYFAAVMVSQILLGILASMIVMWFSRWREFRADAGGAKLSGRANMIGALERLQSYHNPTALPQSMAAFGISDKGKSMMRLFMSHPPLEERIAALRNAQ